MGKQEQPGHNCAKLSASQLLCCNLQCKFTQQKALKQKLLEVLYTQTFEKWDYFLCTLYFFLDKVQQDQLQPFTRTTAEHVSVSKLLAAFTECHVI